MGVLLLKHLIKRSKIRNRLLVFFSLFTFLSTSLISIGAATTQTVDAVSIKGGRATLSGPNRHSFGDIYASVIFSNGTNKTADAVNISYSQLASYPADDDKNQMYGQLVKPDSGYTKADSTAALEFANYAASLYHYDWLSPVPKQGSNVNIFSRVYNYLVKATHSHFLSASLSAATYSAGLFDGIVSVIMSLEHAVTDFNVMGVLGIKGNSGNSLFAGITKNLLDVLGISPSFIKLVQYVFYTLILMTFLLAILIALLNPRSPRMSMWVKFKRFLVRILVIFTIIPVYGMLSGIIDSATAGMTSDFKSPDAFNQSYVVDTLAWAATMNLDYSPINANADLDSGEPGTPTSTLAPTSDNIRNLMTRVNALMSSSGLNKSQYQEKSAKASLQDISSKQEASVVDYFGMVSQAKPGTIYASDHVVPSDGLYMANHGFDAKKYYDASIQQARFLKDNADKSKSSSSSDSDSDSKSDSKTSDNASADQKNRYGRYIGTSNVARHKFLFMPDGIYSQDPVKWNDPSTYIYGAVPATDAVSQQNNYNDYINGRGTDQNNNPETGEEYSSFGNDGDGKEGKIMATNSATIGVNNRYNGMKNSTSLSTQSTAFLLQTAQSGNNSLQYAGYNTYADPAQGGGSKNTGINGVSFTRYTMPNTGIGDLTVRIGALTMVWVTSFICAALALIYLLRAPLFGAIFKVIKGFLSGFFTGNLPAALESLAYYAAMKASFSFALIGAYLGSVIAAKILSVMPAGVLGGVAAGQTAKGVPIIGKFMVGSSTSDLTIMFMAVIICAVLAWPAFDLRFGQKTKRVSVLGAIVLLPYMLAESLDDYLDQFNRALYGKSRSQTFGAKFTRNAQAVDQKKVLQEKRKNLAITGAKVAGGALTGGAGAAIAGKVATGLAGSIAHGGTVGKVASGVAKFAGAKDSTLSTLQGVDGLGISPEKSASQNAKDLAKDLREEPQDARDREAEDAMRLATLNGGDLSTQMPDDKDSGIKDDDKSDDTKSDDAQADKDTQDDTQSTDNPDEEQKTDNPDEEQKTDNPDDEQSDDDKAKNDADKLSEIAKESGDDATVDPDDVSDVTKDDVDMDKVNPDDPSVVDANGNHYDEDGKLVDKDGKVILDKLPDDRDKSLDDINNDDKDDNKDDDKDDDRDHKLSSEDAATAGMAGAVAASELNKDNDKTKDKGKDGQGASDADLHKAATASANAALQSRMSGVIKAQEEADSKHKNNGYSTDEIRNRATDSYQKHMASANAGQAQLDQLEKAQNQLAQSYGLSSAKDTSPEHSEQRARLMKDPVMTGLDTAMGKVKVQIGEDTRKAQSARGTQKLVDDMHKAATTGNVAAVKQLGKMLTDDITGRHDASNEAKRYASEHGGSSTQGNTHGQGAMSNEDLLKEIKHQTSLQKDNAENIRDAIDDNTNATNLNS